jgi:hypothetical protein
MAKHGFTLYSPAQISREEYLDWLRQFNKAHRYVSCHQGQSSGYE